MDGERLQYRVEWSSQVVYAVEAREQQSAMEGHWYQSSQAKQCSDCQSMLKSTPLALGTISSVSQYTLYVSQCKHYSHTLLHFVCGYISRIHLQTLSALPHEEVANHALMVCCLLTLALGNNFLQDVAYCFRATHNTCSTCVLVLPYYIHVTIKQ